MPKKINTESLMIRVLFSAVILFFSLQVFGGYRDPAAVGGSQAAGGENADWVPGSPVVTFFLQEYTLMPYVRVMVNGDVKGAFSRRYVTVAVRDGDSIDIDGTFYTRPVSIEVLDVTSGVKNPRKGSVFVLNGNVLSLGEVKHQGN